MKINNLLAMCLASLAVAGCAQQTVVLNESYNNSLAKEEIQPFFIAGIAQNQNIYASRICGSSANVSKIETVYSPIDILATIFTLGIFTPRDAKVYCSGYGNRPISVMGSLPSGIASSNSGNYNNYNSNYNDYRTPNPSYGYQSQTPKGYQQGRPSYTKQQGRPYKSPYYR